jgi:hypothetical protein
MGEKREGMRMRLRKIREERAKGMGTVFHSYTFLFSLNLLIRLAVPLACPSLCPSHRAFPTLPILLHSPYLPLLFSLLATIPLPFLLPFLLRFTPDSFSSSLKPSSHVFHSTALLTPLPILLIFSITFPDLFIFFLLLFSLTFPVLLPRKKVEEEVKGSGS